MGSFCVSCCVSGQVVADNDKCRVVAIKQESSYRPVVMELDGKTIEHYGIASSGCGPASLWAPVTGFIPAHYADYGAVAVSLDDASRLDLVRFFGFIYRKSLVVKGGENSCHDVPFDFGKYVVSLAESELGAELLALLIDKAEPKSVDAKFDELLTQCWDYIYDVAREHRVFVTDNLNIVRPLQFAIIHEEAYQGLIKSAEQTTTWDGRDMEISVFLADSLNRAKATAEASVIRKMAWRQDNNLPTAVEPWEVAWAKADAFRDELSRISDDARQAPLYRFHEVIRELWEADATDTQIIAAGIPFVEQVYALMAMDLMNIRFQPVHYAGQDYDNSSGQVYANFVAKTAKAVVRHRSAAIYGEFVQYRLTLPTKAMLDSLIKAVPSWDCAINQLEVKVSKGKVIAVIEVTLDRSDLVDCLAKNGFSCVVVRQIKKQ